MRDGVEEQGSTQVVLISFSEHWLKRQADLMERFSKSRHLEELHKHRSRDKKGTMWISIQRSFGGDLTRLDRRPKRKLQPRAAHLRVERSQGIVGLPTCYLVTEQRIMRRVEVAVSSVYIVFEEHLRWFVEQTHLSYTPMTLMIEIVRAAMAAVPLTSSSTAADVGTSDAARVSSSIRPSPSIDVPSTSTVDPPPPPGTLVMFPRIIDTCTF
ncbi:hypothetical protein M9H77_36126 [Catharanthus roseus]|uniref:Uncharacterized protein n=1 Tax=Catharanthus roseus TaxID=4058 RepID=A0ACB9ZQW7_CATRO|nr:hypothetical protein M9H77_36126 [Catharanthus roseus]